jgi:arsenate reductase (glutaredoxin)
MEIWLNPDCTKCRIAIKTLDEAGMDYVVRRYLDDPPTAAELAEVVNRLGLEPWDVARLGEPVAAELGLADWPRDPDSRQRWLRALAEHPILIQRPIITAGDGHTVIGRSESALDEIIEAERPAGA